jgi:hypothetical protein
MAKRVLITATTLLALGVFGVSSASATVRVVCKGPPKCAYTTIQAAINAASSGETIHIDPGTYEENLQIPGTGSATSLTLRGKIAHKTTIEYSSVVISPGVSVMIAAVTITKFTNFSGNEGPGAILNEGTLTLNGSTVSGNTGGVGGGIYNRGTMTLNNSTVSGNAAGLNEPTPIAGGIYNVGTMTLNKSTVSGNEAFYGDGIGNVGTMTLNNSTVSGNEAGRLGSGIENGGTMTLNKSKVIDNGYCEAGSGIFNDGTVTLNNSTVSGNTAAFGGGIDDDGGAVTLNGSTVSGNTATSTYQGGGGGISSFRGTVTGRNDTVTGNIPNGIASEYSTVALTNSLVQSP